MYKLRKGRKKYKNNNIVFFDLVCNPNIPDFYSSLYVNNKSKNSSEYGRQVANKLIRFLNFLNKHNLKYWNATDNHVQSFFLYLINFDIKTNEIVNIPKVSYPTLIKYKSVIINFYKFLWQFTDHSVLKIGNWENGKYFEKSETLVLQWKDTEKLVDATLDLFLTKYKTSEKELIKEYTEEEISSIYSCFNNYRNRAIFLITLHGMRIDEVLSIKLKDYKPQENTVNPSRSKGKGSGKKRTVVIDDAVVKTIENYILHERNEYEKKAKQYSEYLFISMQKIDDSYNIFPYTYAAYRNSFILTSKKAGLDNVRTHSGRSHRATELLKLMLEGRITLSDELIRHIMGWKDPNSIKPYVEHANEKIAMNFSKDYAKDINQKLNKLKRDLYGK